MEEILKARSEVVTALEKAQEARKPSVFQEHQIGEQVWLEGTHLKRVSGSPKLSPRRYGPFRVAAKISKVAYQLDLPETWNIHNVFHASLLTKYKETPEYGPNYTQPAPEIIDDEPEWEVETIIDDRTWGRWKKKQYKVRWKGYAPAHDSWVDEKDLHAPELIAQFEERRSIKARTGTLETASPLPPLSQLWLTQKTPHSSAQTTPTRPRLPRISASTLTAHFVQSLYHKSQPANPQRPRNEPATPSPTNQQPRSESANNQSLTVRHTPGSAENFTANITTKHMSHDDQQRVEEVQETPIRIAVSLDAGTPLLRTLAGQQSPVRPQSPPGSTGDIRACANIPIPELGKLHTTCQLVQQHQQLFGDLPPPLQNPELFHPANAHALERFLTSEEDPEDHFLYNYTVWKEAIQEVRADLQESLPLPGNTPYTRARTLLSSPSLTDDDPARQGWMEYNAQNPNHYPVFYTNLFGQRTLAKYIRYTLHNGIPTVQGCLHPAQGIYGDTLHPKQHPNPVSAEEDPKINDTNFKMFDPTIDQRLVIDHAVAALNDIGVNAEVARWRAAKEEERRARMDKDNAEERSRMAHQKRLRAEERLYLARVPTRIAHLILDPSVPPTPEPVKHPALPSITAAQGPADDPEDRWGPPCTWPAPVPNNWIIPPITANHFTILGPCLSCQKEYHIANNCPFKDQCHACWHEAHTFKRCPVCPAPIEASTMTFADDEESEEEEEDDKTLVN